MSSIQHIHTEESSKFIEKLKSLRNKKQFLSGAFSYTPPEKGINERQAYFEYIRQEWGITPCIYGSCNRDVSTQVRNYNLGAIPLMHFSPGANNSLLDEAGVKCENLHSNGIIHYDVTNENRNMEVYQYFVDEIKKNADFFEQLEKQGVKTYMYRPFLEMNNSVNEGFFGVDEKGFEAFRNVWRQMYNYFYNERGLKGLLMVFSPAGFGESKMYYPGDEYVDIIAPTCYSELGTGEIEKGRVVGYDWMLNTGKPVAFSETSVRKSYYITALKSPAGDWLKLLESVKTNYPELSFLVSWFGTEYTMFPPNGIEFCGNNNGYEYITDPAIISVKNNTFLEEQYV